MPRSDAVRAIGVSAGIRRELFDYAGALAATHDASEFALSLDFAIRDEIGRAEALVPDIVRGGREGRE